MSELSCIGWHAGILTSLLGTPSDDHATLDSATTSAVRQLLCAAAVSPACPSDTSACRADAARDVEASAACAVPAADDDSESALMDILLRVALHHTATLLAPCVAGSSSSSVGRAQSELNAALRALRPRPCYAVVASSIRPDCNPAPSGETVLLEHDAAVNYVVDYGTFLRHFVKLLRESLGCGGATCTSDDYGGSRNAEHNRAHDTEKRRTCDPLAAAHATAHDESVRECVSCAHSSPWQEDGCHDPDSRRCNSSCACYSFCCTGGDVRAMRWLCVNRACVRLWQQRLRRRTRSLLHRLIARELPGEMYGLYILYATLTLRVVLLCGMGALMQHMSGDTHTADAEYGVVAVDRASSWLREYGRLQRLWSSYHLVPVVRSCGPVHPFKERCAASFSLADYMSHESDHACVSQPCDAGHASLCVPNTSRPASIAAEHISVPPPLHPHTSCLWLCVLGVVYTTLYQRVLLCMRECRMLPNGSSLLASTWALWRCEAVVPAHRDVPSPHNSMLSSAFTAQTKPSVVRAGKESGCCGGCGCGGGAPFYLHYSVVKDGVAAHVPMECDVLRVMGGHALCEAMMAAIVYAPLPATLLLLCDTSTRVLGTHENEDTTHRAGLHFRRDRGRARRIRGRRGMAAWELMGVIPQVRLARCGTDSCDEVTKGDAFMSATAAEDVRHVGAGEEGEEGGGAMRERVVSASCVRRRLREVLAFQLSGWDEDGCDSLRDTAEAAGELHSRTCVHSFMRCREVMRAAVREEGAEGCTLCCTCTPTRTQRRQWSGGYVSIGYGA